MKLSKKVLAAFSMAAALAMASTFVACTEDDDDDFNLISKDNSDNFTINATNDTGSVQRGYKTTSLKHSGALTQITMNKACANSGAMGYIWDLESANSDGTYSRAAKDTRRFLIAGFNYNGSVVKPYVSLYKDVVDIQANNFGATGTTQKETTAATAVGDAKETEYLKLGEKLLSVTPDTSTGDFVITLDVYEDGNWTWNEAKTKRVYTSYNGGYIADIYVGALTLAEVAAKTSADATATIKAADLGYITETSNTAKNIVKQQTCAVYANVYAGKTLKGSFKYTETYAADEVVEE